MKASFSSDLKKSRKHEVLAAERYGDTLVVTPLGDIPEFSKNVIDEEFQRVRRLAGDEGISNIVCDFSEKSYFAQEMVVPLIGLRDQVRTRGRFVAAGMSDEMTALFSRSESGTHILQFPTRSEAIGHVAKVSFGGRVRAAARRNRWLFRALGAVAFCGLLAACWFTFGERLLAGSRARQLYRRLEYAWADAQRVVDSKPTKANWKGLGDRFQEQVFDPLIEFRADENLTPAEKAVMNAASTLQGMSRSPQGSLERGQDRFLEQAEAARLAIEEEDEITLPRLEPILYPVPETLSGQDSAGEDEP